jgi:FkbM family methyltransferase
MAHETFKRRLAGSVKAWLSHKLAPINHRLNGTVEADYLGTRITYDRTTVIGRLLSSTGEFEKREMEHCAKYIPATGVVLDVGANIGLHSIYFSRLAKDGCVLALEPSLATFGFLTSNVANIPNIVALNVAASDRGGIADFFNTSDNAYSSLIDTQRKAVIGVARVPCMRIDDVASALGLERIDFVKIDVEGLEFQVLMGMSEVISKHQPVILCEVYKGRGSNQRPDETIQFIIEKGYRALVMRESGLVDYERHDDSYFNYLFVPISR